ncbi:TonB-dependent siderophore receptor [Pseudomonas haemolytica]|uniref:TonB-dependent siderophore receptor n=1 Tax=Pseudomonas haemolytica TaxID=2600065 RepID=A0ABS1GY95_9PSED|nr:TonB-dependent siderophore receptor [Pseudomonas haemolytica]MBJ2248619.1 TonB-dependent siderophore receptor [Pseudomonas haemolytica]MBJ2276056.1 TonB-dependent siderophore receptor [Pseudomonas haemolytica]MBK3461949.1 TonB-dependent siderophore receptor [Pseudomonas haemolytica]
MSSAFTFPQPLQRSALALTLRSVLLAGVTSLPLASFAVQAENVDSRHYDLAGGPLDDALNRFAQVAGISLPFDPALVQGKRAPALRGDYGVHEGLNRLLVDSGLAAIRTARGNYLLVARTRDSEALELGATTISGLSLGAATENSGSYTTGVMQTATKLPLSLRETPQSVTVITRQRMDDQAMRSLDDVVQATPGLRMSAARPANSEFFARGFPITNIMFDGLPTTYNADWVATADLAPYDRVEVVRGATGMMQGAGNPSAAINMVRKRPTKEFQASITGSAGSWDNYRSELDVSGPVTDSGSVRGRFVGAYHDKDSYQDYAGRERGVFYGVTEFDLTDSTTLTVGASDQNDNNNINWGGLPVNPNGSHMGFSRSKSFGYSWSHQDIDNKTLFVELDQRFDNDWRLHLGASKNWSDFKLVGAVLERNNDATYRQRVFNQGRDYDQSTYDFFASGPFALMGRQHELVVGASKRELKTEAVGGTTFINNIDINHFNPNTPRPFVPDIYSINDKVDQEGLYVTTRWDLADPLKVILGARLDWYDSTSIYNQTNDQYYTSGKTKETRHLTRYAGVIYDLDDNHSVYASYTDIFQPQSEKNSDGAGIKPITGENYEVGIKGEYFGGALNASASLFQIDQLNRAAEVADASTCRVIPVGAYGCYEAAGKVRSQGIELEINGALTPNWQVGAGYTFAQAKYKKDADTSKEGTLFDTDVPRHMFKASTTYHLQGDLNKLRVGANVYSQSSTFNKGRNVFGNYHIEQEAYALVGLMAGYQVSKHLDTQLNINNLFDKKYYQGVASNSTWSPYDVYGDPRNFTVTAKYTF